MGKGLLLLQLVSAGDSRPLCHSVPSQDSLVCRDPEPGLLPLHSCVPSTARSTAPLGPSLCLANAHRGS